MEYPGFMQLLAEIPERDEAWKQLLAGLLVVRLAHAAFHDLEAGPEGLRVVRRAIRGVNDLREVRRLERIVDAARATSEDWSANDVLSGLLMSYAVLLHKRGYRVAGADVCSVLIKSPIDDMAVRLSAMLNRAFAHRVEGRLDPAEADYRMLRGAASLLREAHMYRQAELGLAKVMIERGNYQFATPALEELRDEAREANDHALLGIVLLDLAALAGLRKDYGSSIAYSEEALAYIVDASQRERCYVNMARAARDIGDPVRAGQYAALVRETGLDADIRARAGLILYVLAIDAGRIPARDAARQWLEGETLAPGVECDFREAIAYACAMDGEFDEAIAAVNAMLAVAERHRLGEMIHQGDTALGYLKRRRVPPVYFAAIRSVSARESVRGRALRVGVRHAATAAQHVATSTRLVLTGTS